SQRTPSFVGLDCSMNATCRHVSALSSALLSNDMPVSFSPSSGTAFHSSHALQPMQIDVSVKKPTCSSGPAISCATTSHLLSGALVDAGALPHRGDERGELRSSWTPAGP